MQLNATCTNMVYTCKALWRCHRNKIISQIGTRAKRGQNPSWYWRKPFLILKSTAKWKTSENHHTHEKQTETEKQVRTTILMKSKLKLKNKWEPPYSWKANWNWKTSESHHTHEKQTETADFVYFINSYFKWKTDRNHFCEWVDKMDVGIYSIKFSHK